MDPVDTSVLDEVIGAITAPDQAVGQAVAERLGASRERLGELGALAVRLSAMRRRAGPPTERRVMIAVGADLGETSCAAAVRAAAAGTTPLAAVARSVGARLVVVDAGVRGAGNDGLGPAVIALRAGDGARDPGSGAAMSASQAVVAVQSGIALVLSLVSEGLDVLAIGDLAEAGNAAAPGIGKALGGQLPPPPLVALARHGGFQHGVLAGVILAAAAVRVPVLLDGPSAAAAALLASRFAPDATAYVVHAAGPTQVRPLLAGAPSLGDGTAAALAMPVLGAAAHLAEALR